MNLTNVYSLHHQAYCKNSAYLQNADLDARCLGAISLPQETSEFWNLIDCAA